MGACMSNHADVDDQMLQDSIHVMRKSVLRKSQTNMSMSMEYKTRGVHPLMSQSVDSKPGLDFKKWIQNQ